MLHVDQTEAVLNAALGDTFFDLAVNRNDGPTFGDFHPEFFGV